MARSHRHRDAKCRKLCRRTRLDEPAEQTCRGSASHPRRLSPSLEVNVKLALGPILYYWQRDALFEFYERIEAAPVDIVYLGETVCSKRHNFRLEDWLEVAKNLAASGKQVVLSTQALIESESDLKTLRRLAENGSYTVEANDMAAVRLLSGKQFVDGPHINTYNPQTLTVLAGKPQGMETEVFAYGRLPLAVSARCFTARHYSLPKDDCQFRCLDHACG